MTEQTSACTHGDQIIVQSTEIQVCPACVSSGDTWVNLRLCTSCGHVGCCEDSKNQHALKHFRETKHPIVHSMGPWEDWYWCYPDETFVDVDSGPGPAEGNRNSGGDTGEGNAAGSQIIRSYLILTGLYTLSASLIWGVNTLFLLDAGLDILEVFIANAAFTGAMALFEIPTGVLADTRGRRLSFLLSIGILVIGTLGYIQAAAGGNGLGLFITMSIVLGLGYTFYSGAMEAWLVDALNSTGYTEKLDSVFARAAMVSGAAMLVGTITGGILGGIDLAIPFWVRTGLLLLVLGFAYFTMHDLGFEPRGIGLNSLPGEMRKVAQASIAFGWNKKQVRYLILAGLFHAGFTAWGFYAWQPHFLELLGQNLAWVSGVIAALVAFSMIIGNSLVEFFTRYCGKRTTLLLWASGGSTVVMVGVGLANNFYLAVGFYLLGMIAYGVIQPVKQAYLHQVIPSDQRATVISFDSLVSSGGSMAGQTGLGYLAQVRDLASGYVFGGITTILAIPMILLLRRMNQPEDLIIGKAGAQSACAAQGIPQISGIAVAQGSIPAGDD